MKDTRKKLYETRIFYVCLCVGLFGILVVGAMQNRERIRERDYSMADLNEPAVENPIAKATAIPAETAPKAGVTAEAEAGSAGGENVVNETVADNKEKTEEKMADNNRNIEENTADGKTNETTADNNGKKSEITAVNNGKASEITADNNEKTNETKEKMTDGKEADASAKTEEDSVSVLSNQNKHTFSFDEEKGLLWPVNGELLMKFNMDSGVYFKTLGQYKCNPAILIKGTVGKEVYSAAAGKVTAIEEHPETGMTVTMDIGNEYELVYGQLENLKVKKGDLLSEGQVIGTLAEPTRYYVEEGCNLYFEVLEKGESVDPMLLLQ